MTMLIMIVLGGIILTILCYKDYRTSVVKPKNHTMYYVAFTLFSILNWAIYLTLCAYFLELPFLNYREIINTDFETVKHFFPFGIACIYFGLGAGTINIGTFEFKFYSKLLDLFQHMFPKGVINIINDVDHFQGKERYDQLKNNILELRIQADLYKNWDPMDKQYKEVNEDTKNLINQIDEFSEIKDDLNTWPLTREDLEETNRKLKKKLDSLWINVNTMLTRFVIQFVFTNIKDQKQQENKLSELGLIDTQKTATQIPASPISRLIGGGIFAGMFVGLVTAFMAGGATTKPPIVNMWCGVIAFTSFTLVFSQFHKIKKMGSAILIGLIGGSLGHLIWIFCDQFQIGYAEKRNLTTAISFAMENIVIKELIIGAMYGATSALILYVCRQNRKLVLWKRYCLSAILGGLSYSGLIVLVKLMLQNNNPLFAMVPSFFLGAIVLFGLSYATKAFQSNGESEAGSI